MTHVEVGVGAQCPSAEATMLSAEWNLFQTQRQPKGDSNQNQKAFFSLFLEEEEAISSSHSVPSPAAAAAAAEQSREQKTA